MFKAAVLSGFIIATTVAVQEGYDALLASLDSYMTQSYGVLAESDDPSLRGDGQTITNRYQSIRKNY